MKIISFAWLNGIRDIVKISSWKFSVRLRRCAKPKKGFGFRFVGMRALCVVFLSVNAPWDGRVPRGGRGADGIPPLSPFGGTLCLLSAAIGRKEELTKCKIIPLRSLDRNGIVVCSIICFLSSSSFCVLWSRLPQWRTAQTKQ